jgi:hypothetical protein
MKSTLSLLAIAFLAVTSNLFAAGTYATSPS